MSDRGGDRFLKILLHKELVDDNLETVGLMEGVTIVIDGLEVTGFVIDSQSDLLGRVMPLSKLGFFDGFE